jgi:Holliday junction resolvase RusA-like endonuclease
MNENIVVDRVLRLHGHCPTKKNNYRRSKHGGMYKPKEINALLGPLQLQIQAAWKLPPLNTAKLDMTFYVRDGRSDLDGKQTSIIDLLVNAGVIVNDSIAHIQHIAAHAAITGGEESVEIRVVEV